MKTICMHREHYIARKFQRHRASCNHSKSLSLQPTYARHERRGKNAVWLPEEPLPEIPLSSMHGNTLKYNRFVYNSYFLPLLLRCAALSCLSACSAVTFLFSHCNINSLRICFSLHDKMWRESVCKVSVV